VRHAAAVALEAERLQPELVHVRHATRGGHHVFEPLGAGVSFQPAIVDLDLVAHALDTSHVRIRVDGELAAEGLERRRRGTAGSVIGPRRPPRPRTTTRTPSRASAWPSSSPMTPGPKTATERGQVLPVEDVVVHDRGDRRGRRGAAGSRDGSRSR
jgi:hypothetical protein